MILLDTSALVYAVGAEHPLREPCRRLVAAIGDGRVAATATIETLQEFAHVRARRRDRADAARLVEVLGRLLAPLIRVDEDDLADGMRLFARHERLGAFDAVLAAVVLRREHLTAIVSADRAFGDVPGLAHLDPASPDFGTRLGIG